MVVTNCVKPVSVHVLAGDREAAVGRVIRAGQRILGAAQPATGEQAVVDPPKHDVLVLVGEARADEVAHEAALRLVRPIPGVVLGPVRHAAPDDPAPEPVEVVDHALTARERAADVRSARATQPFSVAVRGPGRLVVEHVAVVLRDLVGRIARRPQHERLAVAPPPAQLRRQQLLIEPCPTGLRLQEPVEPGHVLRHHAERREAAVAAELRHRSPTGLPAACRGRGRTRPPARG